MSVEAINIAARRAPRTAESADCAARYRLQVRGIDAADVVASAGGWLVDRVMAGWDVHVTLTTAGDLRPLRILGAATGTPDDGADEDGTPVALALSLRVLAAEQAMRGEVETALRRGRTEVTVWGADRPEEIRAAAGPVLPVQHVLSAAARAFKAQALAAAGLDPLAVGRVEAFRTANRCALPVKSDLTPV